MDEKLLFVQFLHPGGEHGQDLPDWKCWNRGSHKRKFLRRPGKHVGSGRAQEILFWGEWEPESMVRGIANPVPHGPNFIHEPCYVVPKSCESLQNTDPFVFGEEFLWGFCRQPSFPQLTHLRRGSVILFGSCRGNGFVLDTVFVVGNRLPIEHSSVEDLKRRVPQEYMEVTVLPWYQNAGRGEGCAAAKPQKCRLYFGANPDNPVNGMYSFFPCQPCQTKSRGFARPRIKLPGRIGDNLNRGVKFRGKDHPEQLDLDMVKSLWDKVAEQVKDSHLEPGVYAEMPGKCSHAPCSERR